MAEGNEPVTDARGPGRLRALAEAQESVRSGDILYGVEAARALLDQRKR